MCMIFLQWKATFGLWQSSLSDEMLHPDHLLHVITGHSLHHSHDFSFPTDQQQPGTLGQPVWCGDAAAGDDGASADQGTISSSRHQSTNSSVAEEGQQHCELAENQDTGGAEDLP